MKCVLFGDSITDGIGSKHLNYENDLINLVPNLHIYNFAKSGETILYSNMVKNKAIDNNPDIAVVFCGSVDGLVRANLNNVSKKVKLLIPKRYQRSDMLEQRPFYSKNPLKRIINYIDNFLRKIFKLVVLKTGGKYQRTDLKTFDQEYNCLIDFLNKNGVKCVLISTMYLDDRYFLNSCSEFEKYNNTIFNIATKYKCDYVDLFNIMKEEVGKGGWKKYYSHDHFHPNKDGYRYIAEIIAKRIMSQ